MADDNNNTNNGQQDNNPTGTQQTPEIDYEKLAGLINGKMTATEDTVLKSYFKEQGLSKEEMKQAIATFKEQKAQNTPDINKMQSDLNSANTARLQAEINQSATLEAIKQGVDVKQIEYVLKLADLKEVTDDKGNINAEKLTEAIKNVLENVPAFKKEQQEGNTGFNKIGGNGQKSDDNGQTKQNVLPQKRWNRFNY